ncbi:hypothetical protein N7510_008744 [Penicillium lagena]|uniref:uncharacterized protein n=1 Tax=Penicillium lagena TaxID=94218 RepID=UPI0025424F18|nr:uncharacterized protein N7510_008744 [Penicillium lagena]KAJ5605963.1 hypothetical protein N7510_008744 [Penicillium lagena]
MTTYAHNLPPSPRGKRYAFSSSPDVCVEFRTPPGAGSRKIKGLDTIRTTLLDHVGPMDTTHMTSNIRVNHKEGEETASLTCYTLAQHCPPGRGKEPDGPKYLAAGEYVMDLVFDKSDRLWKIQEWVLDIIWSQGDQSVMERS